MRRSDGTVTSVLSILLGAVAFMSLSLCFVAHFCLVRKLRVHHAQAEELPPISILKPLKGAEEGLYDNLAAIARQDYPAFEVLLTAEDPADPALDVARRVQRAFPEVFIRISAGAFERGLNPKVRLLRRLLPSASHEWLLVSDSNVRPRPDYLRRLVACQRATGAKLVHSLLVGHSGGGLGGALENVHMNGWVAATIALCDAGLHPTVIGKSMLMHREALSEVGGLKGVEDNLAEDFLLGCRFAEHGHTVALCPDVLPMTGKVSGVGGFLERQVRWAQLRRHLTPAFYFSEPLINPLPLFAVLAAVGSPGYRSVALVAMVVKWLLDAQSYVRLRGTKGLAALLLLPLKDALLPLVWLTGAVRTRVSWRGTELRIGAGTRLLPLEEPLLPGLRRYGV